MLTAGNAQEGCVTHRQDKAEEQAIALPTMGGSL
jgi:hypothetical protein